MSSADYLAGFACQMPPLDSMIKRLKPKMIKDPFVMDSGDHISEVHLLRYVIEANQLYRICSSYTSCQIAHDIIILTMYNVWKFMSLKMYLNFCPFVTFHFFYFAQMYFIHT